MNPRVDISNLSLELDDLSLRPFRPEDLDDFYAYASEPGVGEMAGWPAHTSKAMSRKILDQLIAGKKTLAIVKEGRVIGSLGIEKYEEEYFPELADKKGRSLGFVLAKDYWGQGIMPRLVRRITAYLFEDLALDFILVGHFPRNKQSKRVQEKCGFSPYKTIEMESQSGQRETICYRLLSYEEWKLAKDEERK